MPPIWQLKLPPAPSGARSGLGDMGTPGIDLFTYMVTILNLLDLRSIMGCLGVLAQYLHALSGKKRTSLYISQKKDNHYYIQTRHNDLFSHYNLFVGKLKEKLA